MNRMSKWKRYATRGMVTAAAAMIVTTNLAAVPLTAKAETVQANGKITASSSSNTPQATPSNSETVKQGTCGVDVQWKYDADTKTLTISRTPGTNGTGTMYELRLVE